MGLFDRLKERLTRTREALSDNIAKLFKGGRPIDRALLDELEELLYQGDLGPIAGEVMVEINRLHERGSIKGEDEVRAVLREVLLGFIAPADVKPGEAELLLGREDAMGQARVLEALHRSAQSGSPVSLMMSTERDRSDRPVPGS